MVPTASARVESGPMWVGVMRTVVALVLGHPFNSSSSSHISSSNSSSSSLGTIATTAAAATAATAAATWVAGVECVVVEVEGLRVTLAGGGAVEPVIPALVTPPWG